MLKRKLITGPSPQNPTHTPTHSFNYYVEFNTRSGVNQNYAHSQVPHHEDDIQIHSKVNYMLVKNCKQLVLRLLNRIVYKVRILYINFRIIIYYFTLYQTVKELTQTNSLLLNIMTVMTDSQLDANFDK